ncbi:MAG: PIN domain-containing protein [Gemmatimonadales bacterium]|nr:PIN domain-containing protein [Gemmatimonadales bacterium]MDZ4390453.1 PIN domain-containing protein [Gemmatimonadales bacterium]
MDAFIDTSVLLSIALDQEHAHEWARRLEAFTAVAAAGLLEAELRSACHREGRPVNEILLSNLTWIAPTRSLRPEIDRVLDAGYVRGADCWHLATALYLAPDSAELTFLTLDLRQREVAAALGFTT